MTVLAASLLLNVVLFAGLLFVGMRYGVADDIRRRLGWGATAAVDPYGDQRERFRLHAAGPREVVLVGDSHVAIPQWADLLGRDDVANRGIGGDTYERLRRRLVDVFELDPRVAIVLAGTNDVAAGRDPAAIAHDAAEVLDRLGEAGVQVLLVTVPPFGSGASDADKRNARTTQLNTRLAALAEERHAVDVVDLAGAVTGPGGALDPTCDADGVHLSAAGYARWRDLLVDRLARPDTR